MGIGANKKDLEEVTPLLQKVFQKILTDEIAAESFAAYSFKHPMSLDYNNLSNAAGNHVFDDRPDDFEIKKIEGHTIRAFFQMYSDNEFKAEVEKIIEDVKTYISNK